MEINEKNSDQKASSAEKENGVDNEELAREIPTVTPDEPTLEPVPDPKEEDQ